MPRFVLERPDGARLSYEVFGAAAPSVMLVHGWMVSGGVWETLVPHLREVGVLVVDLRGSGASTVGSSPLSLELFADDLIAVAAHARLDRAHLVGHSMGAQIAQLAAARDPARFRSLALLSPVPIEGLALPEEVARGFRGAGGQHAIFDGILTAACRELSPLDRARLLDVALAIAPEVIADVFDLWTRGAPATPLAQIAAPTMVLATDDPFLPRELLARTVVGPIRGAALESLPGPGHYPQVERPGDTAGRLLAFWRRT